jgi:hypothetical protein
MDLIPLVKHSKHRPIREYSIAPIIFPRLWHRGGVASTALLHCYASRGRLGSTLHARAAGQQHAMHRCQLKYRLFIKCIKSHMPIPHHLVAIITAHATHLPFLGELESWLSAWFVHERRVTAHPTRSLARLACRRRLIEI